MSASLDPSCAGGRPHDAAALWRHVLDTLPHAVAVIDERRVIRFVNERLATLSGCSPRQLVGRHARHLFRSRDGMNSLLDELVGLSANGEGPHAVAQLLRSDADPLAVIVSTSPATFRDPSWTLIEMVDNSGPVTTERHLREQLQRFRLAFENNVAPMSIADVDDRIIEVNTAFTQLVGYSSDELRGADTRLFTHPDDVGISEGVLARMNSESLDHVRYAKRYRRQDGRTVNVEISRSALRDEHGTLRYFICSGRDISERMSREGFLELLAAVNAVALRADDDRGLLDEVCTSLVDIGGYPLAWVALASPFDDEVDIVAAAGDTTYLYPHFVSSNAKSRRGLGPLGVAMRTSDTQVNNDLGTAVNFEIWRERAREFGLASSLAIPFVVGVRSAVLSLYSPNAMAFDEMTVKRLEDLVHEVQLALSRLRSLSSTHDALVSATDAMQNLRAVEFALGQSEQRFRLAFEDNMSPMIFNDLDDRAIAVNDAFCHMVGFRREEIIGADSRIFTHPDDVGITERTHRRLLSGEITQARYEKRYLRKDGTVVISEVSRSAARDGESHILYFVASERDITEERALTAQLSNRALHDPLTSLANRTLFEDRLAHAHARSVRVGTVGAVLLLDLDDFKGVNDTHGHAVGDELLVAIARRFQDVTRSSDTLCRFGGDEFLYLAEDLHSPDEAIAIAERLLGSLVRRFEVNGHDIEQRASVGIVIWHGAHGDEAGDDFIQNADVAMYQAKRHDKGSYAVFTAQMRDQASEEFQLLQELRHALDVGDLTMHYQPIVRLDTLDIVGFESLMRWRDPERGSIAPDVFIPLAEKSDLIFQLGEFALQEALTAASTWRREDDSAPLPFVSVNLSARQFQDPLLASRIENALETSGLAPHRLIIEITESVTLLDVAETAHVIGRLTRTGIDFALDDFGTGYSSLSYLADLQPRIIKIDKSFVNPPTANVRNAALLEAIISLGHQLDGTMLSEGIETLGQLEQLRNLGCQLGQGFLFSPAVTRDQVASLLRRAPWKQFLSAPRTS
ncbi:MAG: EAL domain-containing protein [Acidobacteria bacterium]|nr:EAL domain-containing protein [Acidobacteriota bacterium]